MTLLPRPVALLTAATVVTAAAALFTTHAASAQDPVAPPAAPAANPTTDAVTPAPTANAHDFLAWSMGRYKAMTGLRADVAWQTRIGVKPGTPGMDSVPNTTATRHIRYAAPNRFRVESQIQGAAGAAAGAITVVSDGKKLIEYSPGGALSSAAPASLGAAQSMMLMNPMLAGSLIYPFFGGPDSLSSLVDAANKTAPLRFGPDAVVDGVACKTVKFYAAGPFYGNVVALIGVKDGLVRRLTYDLAGLMKMMKEQGGAATAGIQSFTITENFKEVAPDAVIEETAFDTTPPKGVAVTDMAAMGGGGETKPPVPFGKPAPAFTVKPVVGHGAPVSLASLKGRVVMVDFWATWCGPCRRGLPETLKLHKELTSKGLTVLAVTDEEVGTVTPFLQKNGFASLPAFRDAGGVTNKAYGIQAIPTLAIIDRQGNLSAYMVGLHEPADVMAALKKAGL